jgi:Reverse transcriptase (RNA-dependent DNA polymerase)/Endonuclease/Exonuclease/phosphatase family
MVLMEKDMAMETVMSTNEEELDNVYSKNGEEATKEIKKKGTNTSISKMDIDRKNKKITRYRKRQGNKTKFGTWNIRTLLEVGRMEEVGMEMERYKIGILALQEVRWSGEGRIDKEKYSMLYGGEDKQGKNGTAFMVDRALRDKIMEFKRINGRITYIRIKNTVANISIVNGYAPTEKDEIEEKEMFYEKLEQTCENIPKHDTLVVMGDFNAKIGKEEHLKEVAGKETLHEETTDNGLRLCNLATEMDMIVASTKFKHKKVHKITWTIPGQTKGNQIDHVLIKRKRENMIEDVRSYRGTSVNTDHHLVIAKMKLRMVKSENKKTTKKKWNLEGLNNQTSIRKYQDEVKLLLEKESEREEVGEEWNRLKEVITKASGKVLGRKQLKQGNQWFDNECEALIKRKREARIKWMRTNEPQEYENYKQIRKEGNNMFKNKKSKWIEDKMDEIERDNKNNTKLYQQVKKQKRTKGGAEAIDRKEWEDYLEKEMKQEREEDEDEGNGNNTEECGVEEPTMEEFNDIVNGLKNGKAAGSDEICNEMIRNGGQELKEEMYKLLIKIWKEETIPEEWTLGIIVPIPKAGDLKVCSNYRRITLLNTAYKILTSLILKRLKEYGEREIGEYQNGFRTGRSTVDAIHTLTQVIEKCYERDIDLHVIFIDFKQAFDSLKRNIMIKDAKRLGVPAKLIRMVKMTLEGSKAAIKTNEGITKAIEIGKGVRQGDGLSAMLFNMSLEGIIRDCGIKGSIIQKSVQIIAYADDIAVVARDMRSLEEVVEKINKEAKKRGLEINSKKTKYMKISNRNRKKNQSYKVIGEHQFEEVTSFKYLGIIIDNKNDKSMQINEKIQSGYKAYFRYKEIMKSKKISNKTKLRVYKTAIRPVVTYAAETARLTNKEEERLRIFERKIVRKMFGGKKIDDIQYRRLMNKEILSILEDEDIVKVVKSKRIRWYGHINRRKEEAIIKKITKWRPQSNRPRGRPKIRWEDQVIKDINSMGINGWREKIKDRKVWKKVANEARRHSNL